MRLADDWRVVLPYAWSICLIALAAIAGGQLRRSAG
jgi:hypothetical protein